MIPARQFLGFLLIVALAGGFSLLGAEETAEEEEIELERSLTLRLELLNVEFPPSGLSEAIARFRIASGAYRGAKLSLAYDYTRPLRMLSWDVHDVSGNRRIGGAEIGSQSPGQWEPLFPPGSDRPHEMLNARLIQYDINEDEKDRRWHFIRIEAIGPGELPPPPAETEP